MKSLGHILQRYKQWLMTALLPLGPWAIFVIGFLDAGAFGVPLDPIVMSYVYVRPTSLLLYALMGAAGSALGSTIPYIIGYKGGEAFLVNKIGRERFDRIHGNTEKYGELGLMIACIMPPGFPFKLFVFSAGIAEMTYLRFLVAIFAGRMIRFLLLGGLVIKFGPQVLSIVGVLVKRHLVATLGGVALLAAVIYLIVHMRRRRKVTA